MAKIAINQCWLEYVEKGTGEPLVLVHGSASDHRTWQCQMEAFAERFRVIAYSRRFHWPNEGIAAGADYSMAEQLDDLRALVSSLGDTPVHLVGHSYGAFLALLLAIGHPGLVGSLVLAEPPVVPLFVSNTPRPLEILKLLVTRPRTAAVIMQFGARGVAPATAAAQRGDMDAAMRIFGTAVLGRDAYGRMSPARLEQVRVNAIRAEFLGSGFLPIAASQIRSMQIPTLLITGQRSPRLFHRLTEALAELLPRAQRVDISDASHIIHEDNPSGFRDAVLPFLASQRQARPNAQGSAGA